MRTYVQLGRVTDSSGGEISERSAKDFEQSLLPGDKGIEKICLNYIIPNSTVIAPHIADIPPSPPYNYIATVTTQKNVNLLEISEQHLDNNYKTSIFSTYEVERLTSHIGTPQQEERGSSPEVKQICLIRRRAGISPQKFRDYYENHHAPLAVRLLPNIAFYARNFLLYPASSQPIPAAPSVELEYDVITELGFRNKDDHAAFHKALGEPDISDLFIKDEEKLFDRSSICMFLVREVLISPP